MKNFILSIALMLCTTAFGQNEKSSSTKKIDSLLNLISKNKDIEKQVVYYSQIGTAYYNEENLEKAELYAKKGLQLAEKLNNKKEKSIATFHIKLAEINTIKEDFGKAMKHAEAASKASEKLKDLGLFLTAEYIIGYISGILNDDPQKRINRQERALEIAKGSTAYLDKGKVYYQLSDIYLGVNDLSNAIINGQKALENFSKAKFEPGVNGCYYKMVELYMQTEDWNLAKKYCLLDMETLKFPAYFSHFKNSVSLTRMSSIEMHLGNYASALSYAKKAEKYNQQYPNDIFDYAPKSALILADIHLTMKQPEKAIDVAKSALTYKEIDDSTKGYLYNVLQKSYMQLNDIKNVKLYKDKLISMLKPEDKTIEIYRDLALTSHYTGDYKKAFEYQEKYANLYKEKFQNEKDKKITELQSRFELTEKDLRLKDFTINKQKNELAMASQKNTLLITIAILAVIFLISLFLYWRNRLNKKSNLILKSKNEEIETSLAEKNILLKEIHHRVKNNLQLIISLLNIQARENNHLEVDTFLEKGRGRIISMALIHQNLYEANNLAKVNFQEYLENLINSNAETYGQEMNNVSFSINAKEMYFDVQTSIPLGLIINELICNAMKHAFSAKSEGLIDISISKGKLGNFILHFSDNGVGIGKNKKEEKSFGTELVKLLTMQLKGEVEVDSKEGTVYTISFEDLAA